MPEEYAQSSDPGLAATRRGIQSLDIGLSILEAFVAAEGPLSLTELGERMEMPPSKLHRYVSSFAAAGFLVQRQRSGAYDLGPRALSVGLAALNRNDFVNRAAAGLEEFVERTGQTATLNVWGNQGPTVVRWERGRDSLTTALGLGSVLPLFESATGQIFLSYLPPRFVAGFLEAHGAYDAGAVDDLREMVRGRGYAMVDGRFIPGLNAVAAPVLNWQGTVEVAVTVVARDPSVLASDGPVLTALLAMARSLSVFDPVLGDRNHTGQSDD